MHALLLPKQIALHALLPLLEHDVCPFRVDVQIAVLAADGAVAVGHLLRLERGGADSVGDGAAVAVGGVPGFGGW